MCLPKLRFDMTFFSRPPACGAQHHNKVLNMINFLESMGPQKYFFFNFHQSFAVKLQAAGMTCIPKNKINLKTIF